MSARLSPAANLLRNSKLFAIPPAINLPSKPPSSSEISFSDTATTPYPRFAAIETTYTCGNVGDWGFKRPLPLKTTKSTNNPVVRLLRGIDTPEHVVDFESASDHAITVRKFDELDHPLKLAGTEQGFKGNPQYRAELNHRVFRSASDNTSNLGPSSPYQKGLSGLWSTDKPDAIVDKLPAKLREKQLQFVNTLPNHDNDALSAHLEQPKKDVSRTRAPPTRWRYEGPSLSQISGLEFDEYLSGLGQKEKALLMDRVRESIALEKQTRAREAGAVGQSFKKEEITEKEVQEQLRYLRREPAKFGPMIAKILDLPYVAPPNDMTSQPDWWGYGANTLASPRWASMGTPKTHPSAGLSYATGTNAVNHPKYGPQLINSPVIARAVKKRAKTNSTTTDFGVAGFIAQSNEGYSNRSSTSASPFEKRPGGIKVAVEPKLAFINSEGLLQIKVMEHGGFIVRDDKAISRVEDTELSAAAERELAGSNEQLREQRSARMPDLSSANQAARPSMSNRRPYQNDAAVDDRLEQILAGRR